MGRFKATVSAVCATVLLTSGPAGAQGVIPDRPTVVTISAPVSLPGIVLPAGSYLFRLADSQSNRNIVQIFDKDRTKIFATLIGVSAERDKPEGEAVITFRESPANQPPALRYWYYAGEKGGQEFVYPKDQAMKIARASGESVLAVDTASASMDDMSKAEIRRVDASAAAAAEQNPAPAAQPTPTPSPAEPVTPQPAQAAAPAPTPTPAQPTEPAAQPAQPTEPATPPAQPTVRAAQQPAPMTGAASSEPRPTGTSGRAADMPSDSPRELPRTASSMPLVGVLGFLALGAALGARALRRRLMV